MPAGMAIEVVAFMANRALHSAAIEFQSRENTLPFEEMHRAENVRTKMTAIVMRAKTGLEGRYFFE